MAFTTDDLATLDSAIKTGAKIVQFKDRRVEYQDTAAMIKARNLMMSELSASGASPAPVRQYRMRTERGF